MDYTPTTEEALKSWLHDGKASADFHRWLADVKAEAIAKYIEPLRELKAEAWEEGAVWQRANAVPDDRRMKVRFVSELQAVNPYRQGEN